MILGKNSCKKVGYKSDLIIQIHEGSARLTPF